MKKYLCMFIFLCFYSCHECTCPTVYSENYTENRWQQIRIGMDTNEVKYILGEPLSTNLLKYDAFINRHNGLTRYWKYSNDSIGGEIFPCECWKTKSIFFDSTWIVRLVKDTIAYD